MPNKTCKTVQDKKCHQIPKKECETKYAKKKFEDKDKNKDQEIQRQRQIQRSKLIVVAGTRRSARAPRRRTARPSTSRSAPSNRFRTAKMNRCQETSILHIKKYFLSIFFICKLYSQMFLCTFDDNTRQVCHTTYKEECKPTYNYQQSCKSVPQQKCGYKKKCSTR